MQKRLRFMALAVCAMMFAVSTAWAAGLPALSGKTYTNGIGVEFVRIPAGSFERNIAVMNAAKEFQYRPKATITKPFYLGKYEVTQKQWQAVMGKNPSSFKNPKNPVENVSWNDVQEFIKRLNQKERTKRYRLPTAAEWELAARGGADVKRLFFFMDNPKTLEEAARALDAYAWFDANSGEKTHPVGQKKPNPYGLYDIYGNVWERVQDWYADELPHDKEIRDYRGPASGKYRLSRGGAWSNDAGGCRSDSPNVDMPDERNVYTGFRLALDPK